MAENEGVAERRSRAAERARWRSVREAALDWRRRGEIEEPAARALITAVEAGERAARPPRAERYGKLGRLCLSLGVTLLLAALAWLIAANWTGLGRATKLAALTGSLLACYGFGGALTFSGGRYRFEGRLLIFAGLCVFGLELALIGQIYNSRADSWTLYALWLLPVAALQVELRFAPIGALGVVLANLALLFWWFPEGELAQALSSDRGLSLLPFIALNSAIVGLGSWERARGELGTTARVLGLLGGLTAFELLTFYAITGELCYIANLAFVGALGALVFAFIEARRDGPLLAVTMIFACGHLIAKFLELALYHFSESLFIMGILFGALLLALNGLLVRRVRAWYLDSASPKGSEAPAELGSESPLDADPESPLDAEPSPASARSWLTEALLDSVEAELLEGARIEPLVESRLERTAAREGLLAQLVTIFVTAVATALMSLSLFCLVGLIADWRDPIFGFILSLGLYGGAAAFAWSRGLWTAALTLAVIALVSSGGFALASDAWPLLVACWGGLLGGLARQRLTSPQGAWLLVLGAFMLFGVGLRLGEPFGLGDGGEMFHLGCALLVVGGVVVLWGLPKARDDVIFEHQRARVFGPLTLGLSLAGALGLSFELGASDGSSLAVNLGLLLGLTFGLMRTRSGAWAWAFPVTLGYWILFLFVKYFELLALALEGPAALSILGVLLVGASRLCAWLEEQE